MKAYQMDAHYSKVSWRSLKSLTLDCMIPGALSHAISRDDFFAVNSIDYDQIAEVLDFPIGGATIQCYTIGIITDIAYEGTEEFMAVILSIRNERIELLPFARIVIFDYNGE